MKTKSFLLGLVLVAVGIVGLTLPTTPAHADVSLNPASPPVGTNNAASLRGNVVAPFSLITNGLFVTNTSLIVRPATQTNLPAFKINSGNDLTIYPWFFGTNSATLSNLVFKLELSPNGSQFTTTTPTSYTYTASGTTAVFAQSKVPAVLLKDAMWGRWSVTNTSVTNAMTLSNVFGVWTKPLAPSL